ncbi:peptidoglycan DD-metalloendopeptidase family protein [Bacillus sp. FSL K6-3431]|uniref:peptidoglycan DD-metalloendopeptidase family protein n=1 Tax=Bacillus sp. FSL K6-3431 TaxID=2921500 RepID=UPI0030FB11FD
MNLQEKRLIGKKTAGFLMKLLVFIMAFTTISITATANQKIDIVYHVYLDDQYLGPVSDQKVTDQIVEEAIKDKQKDYEDYQLELGNELTYISEQVFHTNVVDNQVVEQLKDLVTIKANATALLVNDKAIAYVKDETEAELALKKFKLQYVSEKELKQVEANKQKDTSLPALIDDESRVTDVRIEEEITVSADSILPDQMVTVDEAVQLLEKGTLEEKKHKVKRGDVLGTIADAYQLTRKKLMQLNEGLSEASVLQIGQELNVLVTKPLLHVIVEEEVYQEEATDFEKKVVENNSMPKGETKVKQAGKKGKSAITYKVIEKNGKQTSKDIVNETIIEKPVTEVVQKGTKVIPSRGTGSFSWPASGGYVSSNMGQRWGKVHKGIDIARPSNLTIKAADNGVVSSAGWNSGGYGNKIVIDHKNGYRTVYAHLDSISVSPGETVEKGSEIGVMGSTGDSNGTHLHFEVYQNGQIKNPLSYF